MTRPVATVVLYTFNRAQLLRGALDALLAQVPGTPRFEVIVVDNNSTDGTRAVVQRFARRGPVRYVREAKQGLSFARNAGVQAARAALIAFTDDDVRVDQAWIRNIVRAFERHPEAAWVGGRVQPIWDAPPPWLDRAGQAPLAVVDYGDHPFLITPNRTVCLVGANLAVRRRAFDRIGLFSPDVQRAGDSIGSTEDHELQLRLLKADMFGWYDPSVVVRTEVPRHRLSKRYHRVWPGGHGQFYAIMRDPGFEQSGMGAVFGVPAHVFKSAAVEAAAWLRQLFTLRPASAFAHELRLRFLLSFALQRISQGG